jgi:hypothetical protein
VRFTFRAHTCGLVPLGSLAGVLRAGPVEALVVDADGWVLRPLAGLAVGPEFTFPA